MSFRPAMANTAFLLVLTSSVAAPQEASAPRLSHGKVLTRTLRAGQTDTTVLRTEEGDFADIQVMQTGSDVAVRLVDPAGAAVLDVDSPNGANGPEPVAFIATASGDYRIEVKLGNAKDAEGSYRITVLQKRAATDEDRERVAIEKAFAEAEQLRHKRTVESRQAARLQYSRALEYFGRTGDRYREAFVMVTMGFLEAEAGDFRRAVQLEQGGIGIFSAIGDQPGLALAYNNTGGMQDVLGQPQEALKSYQAALAGFRTAKDWRMEALVLNNLGKLYYDMGQWQVCLDNYRQALALFQKDSDQRREGVVLQNMGVAYKSLGEFDQAASLLQQALPLRRAAKDKRGEADTLVSLANIYGLRQAYDKALDALEQSLALRREVADKRGEAITLADRGLYQAHLGWFDDARISLKKAVELARAAGDRRSEAIGLRNLGEVEMLAGKPQEAVKWGSQALAEFQAIGARSDEGTAFEAVARAEAELGNLFKAKTLMEDALLALEDTRSRANSQQLRASFSANRHDSYEFYIDVLMRIGGSEQEVLAFETSERSRARSLMEMLTESGTGIQQAADARLIAREQEISNLLNSKGSRLLPLLGRTGPNVTALKEEIRNLELEYQEVQAALRKSSPRYAALTQPRPLKLAEIQSQVLDDNSILLEYALGGHRSFLWALSRQGLRSFEIPSRAAIEKQVKRVYELLTARAILVTTESAADRNRRIARADMDLSDATERLSSMVLRPAGQSISGKRLVIVPDGALQTIPFGMLPVAGSREPVLTRSEVVTLPSASALAVLRAEQIGRLPAPKTLAVFADPVFDSADPRVHGKTGVLIADHSRVLQHPAEETAQAGSVQQLRIARLPYTLREADEILAVSPEKNNWRAIGLQANRASALSGELSQYRYVHFATHAYLDTERPSLSGLVLSQIDERKQAQDGFLRVNDIYNMRLSADLVVLSACETGLGKEVRGEGLMGLPRAFMYAGAPRVIVSLWNVNDRATAELMGQLYQRLLKEGKRPAEALRIAQLYLRDRTPWQSPYYWAAFQLHGEWN